MVAQSSKESSNSSVTVCGEPPPMLYTILASPPAVKSYNCTNGNAPAAKPACCPIPGTGPAPSSGVRVLFSLTTLLRRGVAATPQSAREPGKASTPFGKYTPTVSVNPIPTKAPAAAAEQPTPKSNPVPKFAPDAPANVSAAFAMFLSARYAYQL